MKGGLLDGLYAMTALQATGFGDFGHIAYVCNPDEEIGSPFSGPLILEQARDADLCFVLEGARENGDIVSARKGVTDVRVSVLGRAAHAGVEPERGRSAILQAAHTILALHGLNGRWVGVTVNVGQISGGIRPNVVAERCDLRVDVRVPTLAAQEEVFDEIELLLGTPVVPETRMEMIRGGGFPPMEKTEATGKLVERAQAIAAEVGFDLRDAATGGASDANPIAGIGVPGTGRRGRSRPERMARPHLGRATDHDAGRTDRFRRLTTAGVTPSSSSDTGDSPGASCGRVGRL